MQHIVKPRAPSTRLLKFLHAQSEGVPFFATNIHKHGFKPPRWQSPISNRPVTTASVNCDSLEASMLPLNGFRGILQRSHPSVSQTGLLGLFTRSTKSPQRASFATTDRSELQERWPKHLWYWNKRKQREKLQPDDLPELASFLDDNSSIGRVRGPENQLKLRCTEFDENGNVLMVNGEFKKSELIAKYGLLPRDLRKIDSSLLPNILVRPSAILINLLHLRVLIKHNRVLVFDAYGSTDSYIQSLFMYDLESKLKSPEQRTAGSSQAGGALPYEFRALESVLISVTTGLEGEFEGVREPVLRVLRELEEDIDRDKLRHLLIYSKKLSSFEQRARLVREAIDDILEADDDLADMYLTEKAHGLLRAEDDHTDVEMLLESYHKVCDEIVQVSGNLLSNIRNTEEIIRAILDSNRNSLMLLELKFNIGTLGLSGGTFVAALYGMNLKNFIEESDYGFWGVSGWCAIVSVVVCVWGFRRLHKVQRLSMWGGDKLDHSRGRTGWGSVAERPVDPVIKMAKLERLKGMREGQMLDGSSGSNAAAGGEAGKIMVGKAPFDAASTGAASWSKDRSKDHH